MGFGIRMWFDALNGRGKRRLGLVVLGVGITALFVGLAIFQTAYGGYESPWWLIAGFFLWLLVMRAAAFGMARLQRRADSQKKGFTPVGGRYAGPVLLVGAVLLVLGLVGVLLDFSIGIRAATGGCGSLPPLEVTAFLACFVAGVALLALVFSLAIRGLRRGGDARTR